MKTTIQAILTATLVATSTISCQTTNQSGGRVKSYTKDTCIVTGNKLGSMGSPITKVYGDQQVKFCCKPCIKKYEADPTRFNASL